MKATVGTFVFALLAMGVFGTAGAEQSGRTNVGEELPPNVRVLLIQEMQAILKASEQIQTAIVQGDHETVAQKAQAIHDSFIMKQQMTEADKQALLAVVPKAFLKRDQALHELSEELAEAGRDQDTTRQLQQFSEMIQGCVGCHSRHATARFPGLSTSQP